MNDFIDADSIFIYLVLLVFGGLYMVAERDYIRVLSQQTGVRLPVVGAGLGWFIKRPWLIPGGVLRLSESLRRPHANPEVEAARRTFLKKRWWILLGAAVGWLAQLPLLLAAKPY